MEEQFKISWGKHTNHPTTKYLDIILDGISKYLGPPPPITFLASLEESQTVYFFDINLWNDGCVGNRLIVKDLSSQIWGAEPPIVECVRHIEGLIEEYEKESPTILELTNEFLSDSLPMNNWEKKVQTMPF